MGKRYARQGPVQVPTIYSGDLAGLEEGMKDALRASKLFPGSHKLSVHIPGSLTLFKVFINGECLDITGDENEEPS